MNSKRLEGKVAVVTEETVESRQVPCPRLLQEYVLWLRLVYSGRTRFVPHSSARNTAKSVDSGWGHLGNLKLSLSCCV